jgi:four helix bundle protein
VSDFRELRVWRKAHKLTLDVYGATKTFPKDEIYGLTSQIRRSALSIQANIAEGCGRGGDVELVRYLKIAQGSASELDSHLELAHDMTLLAGPTYDCLASDLHEVRRMLTTLVQRLVVPKR